MIKIKWKIIAGLLLFLVPLMVNAQFTDTKEIRKSYAITPETQIEITNKYGKIDFKSWDKDSVKFQINIRVEEKSCRNWKSPSRRLILILPTACTT